MESGRRYKCGVVFEKPEMLQVTDVQQGRDGVVFTGRERSRSEVERVNKRSDLVWTLRWGSSTSILEDLSYGRTENKILMSWSSI